MSIDTKIQSAKKLIPLRFQNLEFDANTWPCSQDLLGRHTEIENMETILEVTSDTRNIGRRRGIQNIAFSRIELVNKLSFT